MAEQKRPGVMLYFDVRPCLKRLSLEEKGQLFEGILDYAEFGEVPEFDGTVGVAWDFIQPRIDRDRERYNEVSETRRKAAQKRWEGQGKEDVQNDANASFALQSMPTTTTPSTTTSTPASTATGRKNRKAKELEAEDRRQEWIKALEKMEHSR